MPQQFCFQNVRLFAVVSDVRLCSSSCFSMIHSPNCSFSNHPYPCPPMLTQFHPIRPKVTQESAEGCNGQLLIASCQLLFFQRPRFNRLGGAGMQEPLRSEAVLSFFIRSCQEGTAGRGFQLCQIIHQLVLRNSFSPIKLVNATLYLGSDSFSVFQKPAVLLVEHRDLSSFLLKFWQFLAIPAIRAFLSISFWPSSYVWPALFCALRHE
jgi:hypothetical protein